jgi:hypothetical protein
MDEPRFEYIGHYTWRVYDDDESVTCVRGASDASYETLFERYMEQCFIAASF